ncbi:C-GCAxxG-C-C family protein [Propionispira arboris]|nr:C-GCAxxG-C-C family protein [Propionispira arboris]
MSQNMQNAAKIFNSGGNCCQSVLTVFAEKYGLDSKVALKIACGFGGGVRSGEICGVVSGAAMVIGLKYGNESLADTTAKALCGEKTKEFIRVFQEKHKSIVCRDLLGFDPSTEEGAARAKTDTVRPCDDLVASGIQLLEELGY